MSERVRELEAALRLSDRLREAREAEANYPGCTEGEVGDDEHVSISMEADELGQEYERAREALRW